MPRKLPPPGLMTSKDAAAKLGVTPQMLSIYVKQGKLHREGPETRTHKFYREAEVNAFAETERAFFEAGDKPQKSLPAFFSLANIDDMASIVDIDKRTFHVDITEETYLRWLRKNPKTFFVLRDNKDKIVGYACLLPLKKATMDRFVRGEIGLDDIPADDIDLFEPGRPLHLYIIALCVDPVYKLAIKHTYGASLVRGLFAFILELAKTGVEIETITARTYKADGIRLSRKMGLPQLRSPVIGKYLFSVHVADSGFSVLAQYSDLLAEWKRAEQQRVQE